MQHQQFQTPPDLCLLAKPGVAQWHKYFLANFLSSLPILELPTPSTQFTVYYVPMLITGLPSHTMQIRIQIALPKSPTHSDLKIFKGGKGSWQNCFQSNPGEKKKKCKGYAIYSGFLYYF